MNIVLLDAKTLGVDIDIDPINQFGTLHIYQTTKPHETLKRVQDADIVITNKVVLDDTIIKQAKKLKLICVAATGMNNIDLNAATKYGIIVKNVTGYSTASVVQHTFAMAFYLLEQLSYYDNAVKSGAWSASELFTDQTHSFCEIRGKKWGIVGLGAIGQEVAKVATAFGAEIVYHSTSDANNNNTYPKLTLEELLKTCDIVSIHAPLNENTLNLINHTNLKLLKSGALLLNLGRGGIVNEEDLAQALDSQDIYVGLDVTINEPIPSSSSLLRVSNQSRLLITPHIAWASREARAKLIDGITKNIEDFLAKDGV